MPRIIEPKAGKVVGPLQMKVISNASINDSGNHIMDSNEFDFPSTSESHSVLRRGRYSRKMIELKRSRSKSLPSTKEASLLFGKPLEVEASHGSTNDEATQKAKNFKSQEMLLHMKNSKILPKNTFNISTLDMKSSINNNCSRMPCMEPSERHALALDTRFLVVPTNAKSELFASVEPIIQNFKDLAKSLCTRGVTPCIIASTVPANAESRSRFQNCSEKKRITAALTDLGLGISTHKIPRIGDDSSFRKAENKVHDTTYSQVDIPSTGTDSNTGACFIPLPLHATYSWMLFSAMGTFHNYRYFLFK
jgi:hypothetical protein